jgi:ubiquinone/menaquinone biosynthesis C-methylase UbiE
VPRRKYLETPSFIKLLGDLSNEDVIDLACGEGFYTRILREKTKGKVYGVDISTGMIELAKK